MIAGGPFDDKIWTGNGVYGAIDEDNGIYSSILVYGDKEDLGTFGTPSNGGGPNSGDRLPLVEYPDTFNKYDGNDWIDVGDSNYGV